MRISFGSDIYLLFRVVYLGDCVLYILLFQVFRLNTRSTFRFRVIRLVFSKYFPYDTWGVVVAFNTP